MGVVNSEQVAEIECPMCDATGCHHCDGGYFVVDECPSNYIGEELIADMQITAATDHHLPVAGGLLDQSAWYLELRQTMQREEQRVSQEQAKRRNQ